MAWHVASGKTREYKNEHFNQSVITQVHTDNLNIMEPYQTVLLQILFLLEASNYVQLICIRSAIFNFSSLACLLPPYVATQFKCSVF